MQRAPLPENITLARFGILEALYHLGPLCQRELREKVLRSKGAVSVSVEQLERAGLVSRTPGLEDLRVRQVSLTEEGRTLIAGYFPRYARVLAEEMLPLTSDEQRQLGLLAKKLGSQEDQL
jgi:MarR family 2-MHQ and catechol resistance regulon transcriptional repressor